MSEVLRFLFAIRVADVLDILVITVLLYILAKWLLRRTSLGVALGLGLVLALYFAARYWSMYLTLAVFRGGAVMIVVVLAIVFQEDIRRGFERLASWRPGRIDGVPHPLQEVKETLVEAVASLAHRGQGALIVLAGREPLEAHVRGGVKLNGRPSFPLFLSIFDPKTPGHDGAAILDGPILTHFAVHLPLTKNLTELRGRGTRHAAALGLSESCDAMVIVVSEEQETISVAEGGTLSQLASPAELESRLDAFYTQHAYDAAGAKTGGRLAALCLKAASLAVACLLWGVFVFDVDRVERIVENVPVEYRNLPKGWQVERIDPAAVQIRLSGPEPAFEELDPASLRISLGRDDYEVKLGWQQIEVPEHALNLPPGVELAPGDPPRIRLHLEQIVTFESAVKPWIVGELPDSHRLGKVSVAPEKLRISVPYRFMQQAQTLQTEPISLREVRQSFTRDYKVELPPGASIVGRSTNLVSVSVEILPPESKPN
jgi:DNA integrity scanning protein DisA with diadenylate cyclase activity